MRDLIEGQFRESMDVKEDSVALVPEIEKAAEILIEALKDGKKVLVCGNGGSAAQAQHFVAELVVKFEKVRKALPAISLTTDTSNLTAGANDFGYELVFSRQVEALGNEGDVLVGLTTSGNSENVLKAFEAGKDKGMKLICLNGRDGGEASSLSLDADIVVQGDGAARVQEVHILIIHIWCKILDEIFGD